ncbi:MAG: membrane protein insertase YidC [Gammaproteobacteria bacterium]|nr:membrane protein insertase YidC [Gammaproteobacteria bacterium]
MDKKVIVLYGLFGLVTFNLWSAWKAAHPVVMPATTVANNQGSLVPSPLGTSQTEVETNQQDLVTIQTDVFNLSINPIIGRIIKADLLQFPASDYQDKTPLSLLTSDINHPYFAAAEFVSMDNGQAQTIPFHYELGQKTYLLHKKDKALDIVFKGTSNNGLILEKAYHFTPGSYVMDVSYRLKNTSDRPVKTYLNQQISWTNPKIPEASMFQIGSYTGASFGQPGKHRYKKVSFDDMKKNKLDIDTKGGWVAMQQHYFLSAWVPNQDSLNRLYTQQINDQFIIGSVSEPYVIEPNQSLNLSSKFYVGPEDTAVLKTLAPGLDLTVDYGWLWFLSDALFSLMKTIYNVLGNWGWSIVLITILIKLAFFKLSASSYRSMANMRRLQPKLEQLKQRFGDDKAKFSQATMELYRQEKVNPLGGCLPIIVQIPVFIALYWVLVESVELRHAPFVFWIKDLSASDPLHILPLIMGLTMFIQQKLNPTPPDPTQAKVMMLMPIFFTFLFWGFPSGLVLYWIVNNSLSILQQWWITRKYQDKVLVKS